LNFFSNARNLTWQALINATLALYSAVAFDCLTVLEVCLTLDFTLSDKA